MRRLLLALLLAGCAKSEARATTPAHALPPLAVHQVLHRDQDGFLEADTHFAVVLSRPVERVSYALSLVDDAGRSLSGDTVWLDDQLVVFYPKEALAPGLELHLRLTTKLHARDGASLEPGELHAASTRPIAFVDAGPDDGGLLFPAGVLRLEFERAVPEADIRAHGVLRAGDQPLPYTVEAVGEHLRILATFPPGETIRFGWKEGSIARTSIGRVDLPEVSTTVAKGLVVRLGEREDACKWSSGPTATCGGPVFHLVFSSPIPDAQLAAHIHPAGKHATTGDLRGHRVEIALADKPVALTIDGGLTDVFGQSLDMEKKVVIRRKP